ncbi:kinase-like domain-containing protein [Aspergillus crustosus]
MRSSLITLSAPFWWPFPCATTQNVFPHKLNPRVFPTSGFEVLDPALPLEEETLPEYVAERYYPVSIGEVFNSRYQVVTKLLGLEQRRPQSRFLALKVHIRSRRKLPEIEISKHLKPVNGTHGGERFVRLVLESFEVTGPHGVHTCLLYQLAGIDFHDYAHCLEGNTLPVALMRPALGYIIIALDYLHQANVVHTDVQPHNILLGIDDESIIYSMEVEEISDPAPRELRMDGKQAGLIMPSVYRALEVMLGMEWDTKVDIWAVAQVKNHLFRTRTLDSEDDIAHRFAEMISLLGPPPPEFLQQSKDSLKYWDRKGIWKGRADIPKQTLEERETRLEWREKDLFLQFVRKALHWDPEQRPTAMELLMDEWLRGEDY